MRPGDVQKKDWLRALADRSAEDKAGSRDSRAALTFFNTVQMKGRV